MSCSNCSKNSSGLPKGCRSNGSCSTGGCSQKTTYDWLSNLDQHKTGNDVSEVSFKNGRKGFYLNGNKLSVYVGDTVVVEAAIGKDVGVVSLTGQLVKHQMNRKKVKATSRELKKIVAKAQDQDIEIWKAVRARESKTLLRARELIIRLDLKMKLSDVEFQGDGTKAFFYYTAETRVDFRELIKLMADEFKVRIEMKQIGSRQESARLGGIGSCGRELCCSSWMSDFRSVTTGAARYQQLSLNPQKLAGQCGKLKCCLNFELDQYLEQVKNFPSSKKVLEFKNARGKHFKTDVFKNKMFYFLEKSSGVSSIGEFSVQQVHEILKLNQKGKKPENFSEFLATKSIQKELDYDNVVGQDELTRFDAVFKKKKNKKYFRNKRKSSKKRDKK